MACHRFLSAARTAGLDIAEEEMIQRGAGGIAVESETGRGVGLGIAVHEDDLEFRRSKRGR